MFLTDKAAASAGKMRERAEKVADVAAWLSTS
jgi:hypothetical protein